MRKRTRSFDINNNNNNNSNTTNSPMTKRRALSICKPVEVLTLNNATHEFVERTVKQRLPSILKNIIEKNTTEWKKKGKAFFAMTKMRLEKLRQEVDEIATVAILRSNIWMICRKIKLGIQTISVK